MWILRAIWRLFPADPHRVMRVRQHTGKGNSPLQKTRISLRYKPCAAVPASPGRPAEITRFPRSQVYYTTGFRDFPRNFPRRHAFCFSELLLCLIPSNPVESTRTRTNQRALWRESYPLNPIYTIFPPFVILFVIHVSYYSTTNFHILFKVYIDVNTSYIYSLLGVRALGRSSPEPHAH